MIIIIENEEFYNLLYHFRNVDVLSMFLKAVLCCIIKNA